MMKQRLISLLLMLTMDASSASLLSCSGDTEPPADTAPETAATVTEVPDSLEARMNVQDGLPEKTFEGRTFTILGSDIHASNYLAEELEGEPVNDAIFERNAAISERFDVKLAAIPCPDLEIATQAQTSVKAGDDLYQMMAGHIVWVGMSAGENYMYNWCDLPYVNFRQPWWADSTANDLQYKDKVFVAIGDFALSALSSTYCMFYNKVMADSYNLPDMYALVSEDGWTIDRQYEFSEGVYTDTNGDGNRDLYDTYALSTDAKSNANTYLWAFGKKIAVRQEDGTFDLEFYDDKLVSVIERVYSLFYETDHVYFDTINHQVGATIFPLGNTLFTNGNLIWATSVLRDVEFDYGIIPYPKWDEAQPKYYTSVDGSHEGLVVLKSIQDHEFVGIISEALNAESWKRVVPAYYDISLKYKGARDEQSVAMLDLIVEGRIFDFGYVYGGTSPAFWIQNLLELNSKDITSYYRKNFTPFSKNLERLFTSFDRYTSNP